jgi:hypothetical protein
MRCEVDATATVALRYAEREVLVTDLIAEPDRNLLELCEEHVRTLGPPVGWRVRDDRNVLALPEATPPSRRPEDDHVARPPVERTSASAGAAESA